MAWLVGLAAAAAGLALATTAQAQTARLDGVWTNLTLTPLQRPIEYGERLTMSEGEAKSYGATHAIIGGSIFDGTSYVMRVDGAPRTSILITPDGKLPPARAQVRPHPVASAPKSTDNPEGRSLQDRCLMARTTPVILPKAMANNYQFIQNRKEVVIVSEEMHDVRHIRLDSKTHPPTDIRPWGGDSIGHWEGRTLVVETTNFPRQQAYQGAWQTLKVTERFTRLTPDRLLYRFTVEDASVWDRSWAGEYEFRPANGPIQEWACHEGNYSLEGILAGARAEDAKPIKISTPKPTPR